MNKLKITEKVFVPVSNHKESTHWVVDTIEKNGDSYFTKEETNKYVLSKEEMEKLLNNVSDFGREYVEKTGKLWNDTEKAYQQHKEEFINSIL
jgi:hypothetical protein